MKCSYAKCGEDVPPNEFVLHTIDNNRFFCSVSCFLVDMKLTHIQVWGYSEGLEMDYMNDEHLKLFDLKRSLKNGK